MFLMIDNYDSFTYILVDYFRRLGVKMDVYRHDEITLQEIEKTDPEALVFSPGPKDPDNAGITLSAITHFFGNIPMLGVCLGHQAMGQVCGAVVVRAERLMHGKTSMIHHNGQGLFRDIPSPFKATRYHSLIIDRESMPDTIEITAETERGEVMAISHCHYPVTGVQFHPESILTEYGNRVLLNFMDIVTGFHKEKKTERSSGAYAAVN